MENEKLRYPIGHFKVPDSITQEHVAHWIAELDNFPEQLEKLVDPLEDSQLDTPYREGGWTVRQVVHHVSDSHHNAYTRFKWALTEDSPVIKVYDEKSWAALEDSSTAPIQPSLDYLKALHYKLVYLLKRLGREDMERTFIHPVNGNIVPVKVNIGHYAWHGNHHYAHIRNLLEREGWV